jgi:hypothetical protein
MPVGAELVSLEIGGSVAPTACGACGAGLLAGARFCPACGVRVDAGGDREEFTSASGSATCEPREPVSTTPAVVAGATARGPLVGQVRGLQSSTAAHWSKQQETVLSFFLERFDEEGGRVLLIPVELRGLRIRGVLREGSRVEVTGRRRSGTVRAKRVIDLDTGAKIRGEDIPWFIKILMAVVFAFVVWLFLSGLLR